MTTHLDTFHRVANRTRSDLKEKEIEVHVGSWHASDVLKLTKRRWIEGEPAAAPTDTGIFFSIWVEEKSLKKNQVFYNIHARRLRNLRGHALESRKFAGEFRARLSKSAKWPNVSVKYGPTTLMQGWIDLRHERLEGDVMELVRRFLGLSDTIDDLLALRKSG